VPAPRRSRPAFFLTAVLTAGTFGGCSASGAMSTIESLRAAPMDASRFLATIPFAADRAVVAEALAEVENEKRARRPVLFPLAAANAVVGGALLVFAWGLLSRREGARTMTVQLLGAQIALEALEYALTPALRGRLLALASAYLEAQAHGAGEAVGPELLEALRAVVLRAPAIALFAAILGRALTIAPLVRAETRAFCLAAGAERDREDDGGDDGDRGA
jgi:hypothetical protein